MVTLVDILRAEVAVEARRRRTESRARRSAVATPAAMYHQDEAFRCRRVDRGIDLMIDEHHSKDDGRDAIITLRDST
jgi:hypothetical protein